MTSPKAPTPLLILASASPRRRAFLEFLQVPFLQRPVQIDETPRPAEPPEAYVRRIIEKKAAAALEQLRPGDPLWILCADTAVVLPRNKESPLILGKPENPQEAQTFLQSLSGKPHQVITVFCLGRWKAQENFEKIQFEKKEEHLVRSQVFFRNLGPEEITAYIRTREWQDKAGGYGIQGAGAFLIETIEGSFTNIVGLPLKELATAFRKLDFPGWK